jgi:hypothetical protein
MLGSHSFDKISLGKIGHLNHGERTGPADDWRDGVICGIYAVETGFGSSCRRRLTQRTQAKVRNAKSA